MQSGNTFIGEQTGYTFKGLKRTTFMIARTILCRVLFNIQSTEMEGDFYDNEDDVVDEEMDSENEEMGSEDMDI